MAFFSQLSIFSKKLLDEYEFNGSRIMFIGLIFTKLYENEMWTFIWDTLYNKNIIIAQLQAVYILNF